MSETTTAQQFDTSIAPLSAATVQGQLGPQIVGSGTLNFQGPGTLYLYFAQAGQAQVLYANNYGQPNTPLPPYQWTPIPNVNSLNVAYSASPGSDLKLAWSIVP